MKTNIKNISSIGQEDATQINMQRKATPVSLSSMYNQGFSYHVERFEEWQACSLVSSGQIVFDLHIIKSVDVLSVEIPHAEKFRMQKSASFSLVTSYMLSDRLQYTSPNIDFDATQPIVLQVFVKGGELHCVRFAMTNPDRIVEFYGYQIESSVSDIATQITDTEKNVNVAIAQFSQRRDGYETYLYKAWHAYREDPGQLKAIKNYKTYGWGLGVLSITTEDIDVRQQLASLAYFFISKALLQDPHDVGCIKARIITMLVNQEAFRYTVSSVVNDYVSIVFMEMSFFKARDALFKMEFADLSRDKRLLGIEMFSKTYGELNEKISSNFFGKDLSADDIITEGNRLHEQVFAFIEKKVNDEDINF